MRPAITRYSAHLLADMLQDRVGFKMHTTHDVGRVIFEYMPDLDRLAVISSDLGILMEEPWATVTSHHLIIMSDTAMVKLDLEDPEEVA